MLKLRYLFNNADLAEMVLKNWHYDEDSIGMFKHYRISSNAIYPFKSEGKTHLLRFAPKSEKLKSNILAELDFISYLRDKQYGVLESVASKHGEELVEVRTPWGEYYSSVFKRVSGVQLSNTDLSDGIIFSYGKALGRFHQLSSQYVPGQNKRWSYMDVLNWIQNVLMSFPEETEALTEVKLIRDYFDTIPKSSSNYGLIHYDFECDNVFYDEETASCNAIDFDDAMYHWYAMDIEQALHNLQDHISFELIEQKKQCFIDGYLTEYAIPYHLDELLPACRRFANLYGYARILRAAEEKWDHEPDWMMNLRKRLKERLKEASIPFGIPLFEK